MPETKIGKQTSLSVAGNIAGLRSLFLGQGPWISTLREKRYFKSLGFRKRLGQNSEARGLKLFGIFKTEKERWKDRFLAV